eukprot:COSAG05_NODE_1853_length_3957_cov_1.878434_1_plen_78_part_00
MTEIDLHIVARMADYITGNGRGAVCRGARPAVGGRIPSFGTGAGVGLCAALSVLCMACFSFVYYIRVRLKIIRNARI